MRNWFRREAKAAPPAVPAAQTAAEKRPLLIARMGASIAKLERRGDARALAKADVLRRELEALRLEQQAAEVRAGVVVQPGPAGLGLRGGE